MTLSGNPLTLVLQDRDGPLAGCCYCRQAGCHRLVVEIHDNVDALLLDANPDT